MDPNYYELLGVPPSATLEEIKEAFRARATKLHPDHTKSKAKEMELAGITGAYSVLRHPNLRKVYDKQLRAQVRPCSACEGSGQTRKQKGFGGVQRVKCRECNGTGAFR